MNNGLNPNGIQPNGIQLVENNNGIHPNGIQLVENNTALNDNGTSMRRLFSEGQFNNSPLVSNHNKKRLNRIYESTAQFSHNGEPIPIDIVNYILELSEIHPDTIQRQEMVDTYTNTFTLYMNNNKERWPEEWDRNEEFRDMINKRLKKYDIRTSCARTLCGTSICGIWTSFLGPYIISVGAPLLTVLIFTYGIATLWGMDHAVATRRERDLKLEGRTLVLEAHNAAKNSVTEIYGKNIEGVLNMRMQERMGPTLLRIKPGTKPSEVRAMVSTRMIRGGKAKRTTRKRKPKKKTRRRKPNKKRRKSRR